MSNETHSKWQPRRFVADHGRYWLEVTYIGDETESLKWFWTVRDTRLPSSAKSAAWGMGRTAEHAKSRATRALRKLGTSDTNTGGK